MISGNPSELRMVAVKAKSAQSSLESTLRTLSSAYNGLNYDVPNKRKIDDLIMDAQRNLKASVEMLAEFEKRLTTVAGQLEAVNRM